MKLFNRYSELSSDQIYALELLTKHSTNKYIKPSILGTLVNTIEEIEVTDVEGSKGRYIIRYVHDIFDTNMEPVAIINGFLITRYLQETFGVDVTVKVKKRSLEISMNNVGNEYGCVLTSYEGNFGNNENRMDTLL
jgi:hypothetical protein